MQMETYGQIMCSVGRPAQSGVYGREATHPFHGGHRRHNQDLGTGGTIEKVGTIGKNGTIGSVIP